jgi:hypothetical protein
VEPGVNGAAAIVADGAAGASTGGVVGIIALKINIQGTNTQSDSSRGLRVVLVHNNRWVWESICTVQQRGSNELRLCCEVIVGVRRERGVGGVQHVLVWNSIPAS